MTAPPTTAERRPGRGGGGSASGLADRLQSTPNRRTSIGGAVNVWAHGYLIVGNSGRQRMVLVTTECVFCGRAHQHSAQADVVTATRTASCRRGRYVLHLAAVEGEVAA